MQLLSIFTNFKMVKRCRSLQETRDLWNGLLSGTQKELQFDSHVERQFVEEEGRLTRRRLTNKGFLI